MNNKKKIIAICLCVALLAGTILSGTIAYFTDKEELTNTFTSGNVMIDLDEYFQEGVGAGTLVNYIEKDGKLVADKFNELNLYPADVYTKKPIITVGKGTQTSEPAFVAAKIEIKAGDLTKATVEPEYTQTTVFNPALVTDGKIDIHQLLTGGVLGNVKGDIYEAPTAENAAAVLGGNDTTDKYIMYQEFTPASEGSKEGTYTIYIYANAVKNDGDEIELFNKLSIPGTWDNSEMDELEDLDITVRAFATQEKHLGNCYAAMAAAFPGEFPPVA